MLRLIFCFSFNDQAYEGDEEEIAEEDELKNNIPAAPVSYSFWLRKPKFINFWQF